MRPTFIITFTLMTNFQIESSSKGQILKESNAKINFQISFSNHIDQNYYYSDWSNDFLLTEDIIIDIIKPIKWCSKRFIGIIK